MDKITQNLLNTYVAKETLQSLPPDEQFEHFAAYSMISPLSNETLNISDIIVGGGGDAGMDSIAIFVNGALVSDPAEVDDLASKNKFVSAHFVMLQAKSSSSFDGGKIGTFCFGVKDFFEDSPTLPMNGDVKAAFEVQQRVYEHSAIFRRGKPSLSMYYVTTGKWAGDANLTARIEAEKKDLTDTGLFESVEFHAVDADRLQRAFNKTQSTTSTEILFKDKITLPEMKHVSQAYLGVLPGAEFLKLIEGSIGQVLKPVFYDNVRDFQEYNDVNEGIRKTIRGAQQEYFSLLNNGVTVITRKLDTVGDKFFLEDYQIVNGCQTSHVIHDCKGGLTEKMFVPVRLIATEDDPLGNSVIEATNSQTPVKSEQLLALSNYQKKLESFYEATTGSQRLYYERRAKQYQTRTDVERVRIVTITNQMRSFASMFLNEPHRGHYVRALHPSVGTAIFNKDHQLEPYHTAAYAAYRLEYFFRNGSIGAKYKPARFHLMMCVRYILGGREMPALTTNKVKKYCDDLLLSLSDDTKALAAFNASCKVVDRALKGGPLDRAASKVEQFTKRVLAALP